MEKSDNRIVITGTGIITSLGIGKAETLKKLKAGQQRLTQELENQKNLYRQLLKVLEG